MSISCKPYILLDADRKIEFYMHHDSLSAIKNDISPKTRVLMHQSTKRYALIISKRFVIWTSTFGYNSAAGSLGAWQFLKNKCDDLSWILLIYARRLVIQRGFEWQTLKMAMVSVWAIVCATEGNHFVSTQSRMHVLIRSFAENILTNLFLNMLISEVALLALRKFV